MAARPIMFCMDNKPLYTPLFCEENIWQLARRMLDERADPATLQVLFFSNPERQLVMFNQRRANAQGYIVWDYHVVLQAGELIYDLDTELPCPTAAADYFRASFPSQSALAEPYRGWVRCIPAQAFVDNFRSDRSHMRGVVAESEFPSWPLILPPHDHTVPLHDYIDMQKPLSDGSEVISVQAYLNRLLQQAAGEQ